MTIKEFMDTDCLDIDEILLKQSVKRKKTKQIRPLSDLVKGGN